MDIHSMVKENGVVYDVKEVFEKNIIDGRL